MQLLIFADHLSRTAGGHIRVIFRGFDDFEAGVIGHRVAKLTEEIKGLQPEKEQTSNEDYSVKLLELREHLKEYTVFDYSVIPESIVEAFIERIWVSKDEFRWYLRTGNNADGEFDPDDHIKIGSFTLTIDDAKKYIYSFSTRRRVYKWVDLNVSVWI